MIDAETRYINGTVGLPADAPKPKYYATLKRGSETRTYGPLTSREWAKLIEEERREGWQFVPVQNPLEAIPQPIN
jgi:threonine dehydratase